MFHSKDYDMNTDVISKLKTTDTCRFCRRANGQINIFDREPKIIYDLTNLSKLKIVKNDGLPKYVCQDCLEKLQYVITFLQQCQDSERLFLQSLEKGNSVPLPKDSPTDTCLDDFADNDDDSCNEDSKPLSTLTESNQNLNELNDSILLDENKCEYILFRGIKIFVNRSKKPAESQWKNRTRKTALCQECGKLFTDSNAFARHKRLHKKLKNPGVRNIPCPVCPKLFDEKFKLAQHMVYHNEARNFKCTTCEKAFKTKRHLQIHTENVHIKAKNYACKLCDKRFPSNSRLKSHHSIIHLGEKRYQCAHCDSKFAHKNSLEFHTRTHTGEKPYACKYCDSKFAVPKTLIEHERIHTGERPFVCPVCGKAFYQKGNMKSHFRHNHKGPEFSKYNIT